MGIDRPDVRWIAHTCMPPSIEQYHQEIGRDGHPTDCVVFHSHLDADMWINLKTAFDEMVNYAAIGGLTASLHAMEEYCTTDVCRHRMIVNHFSACGPIDFAPCNACNVCL